MQCDDGAFLQSVTCKTTFLISRPREGSDVKPPSNAWRCECESQKERLPNDEAVFECVGCRTTFWIEVENAG